MQKLPLMTAGLLVALAMAVLASGCGEPAAGGTGAGVGTAGEKPSPEAGRNVGWPNWRGAKQCGVSDETGLPASVAPEGGNLLWSYSLSGRGCPVAFRGRLFTWGYKGEGADLKEYLACLDAETGVEIWSVGINDFLSDVVYNRYSIGSPTVDRESGNVYWLTTAGMFSCFSADGELRWQHSMMEEFGRLTFPNGRTGSPVIFDNLVIVNGITSNWGADGPARDRLYAFDKQSGLLVWTSTPGIGPKDSSFSTPTIGQVGNQAVLLYGTGCGNLVCVNARTGKPLWRYPVSSGGVNASAVLYKNLAITVHGQENVDASSTGRLVAIRIDTPPPAASGPDTPVLPKSAEGWRNDELSMFTSSPTLVGNRVYQMIDNGELFCVDADNGKTLWKKKLSKTQTHGSPLYADGKLYVGTDAGDFYILKCSDAGAEELCHVQLEGFCLGQPLALNGKIYVHTTAKLYCFGTAGNNPGFAGDSTPAKGAVAGVSGPATQLQIVPSEVLLQPGQSQEFTIRAVNGMGETVQRVATAQWEAFVPPTAKVKAKLDAAFDAIGRLTVAGGAQQSAGAFKATAEGLSGTIRGRIMPAPPYTQDFEGFNLTEDSAADAGVKFAYPPLPWIGGRFKWEVRELDGNKVFAKTLDNNLFQRAMTFIGSPTLRDYTLQADVMTAKSKRTMSVVGVINQRYIVSLDGNKQILEIVSNHDRLKEHCDFTFKANTWYTLKSRVDVAADGSGVIRAKAWVKGEPEPAAWTFEVKHAQAHRQGSPGIYGFALQNQARVYVDNITIAPNAAP